MRSESEDCNMQLDRLNKHNLWFSRQDLSSMPFPSLSIEKAPFPSGFGAFSFVANEEARQSQSADHTGEKSACGIGRFGTGNAPVRQAKPYTRSLLALR